MLPLIGRGWTPAELNSILQNHVVRNRAGGALTTFGCVEWESELYRGVMRARCYQWNMPKHRFHKMNPQVIPSYPWLYTYITGYPVIRISRDIRPQLFFKCILLSQNGRPPKNPSWTHGPNDIKACLVFSALLRSSSCRPQGP